MLTGLKAGARFITREPFAGRLWLAYAGAWAAGLFMVLTAAAVGWNIGTRQWSLGATVCAVMFFVDAWILRHYVAGVYWHKHMRQELGS